MGQQVDNVGAINWIRWWSIPYYDVWGKNENVQHMLFDTLIQNSQVLKKLTNKKCSHVIQHVFGGWLKKK